LQKYEDIEFEIKLETKFENFEKLETDKLSTIYETKYISKILRANEPIKRCKLQGEGEEVFTTEHVKKQSIVVFLVFLFLQYNSFVLTLY